MVVKFEKKTICGEQWGLNTLPASDGIGAVTQLTAIVGGSLGSLAGKVGKKTTLADLAPGVLGDAVSKMTLQLADPSTLQLVHTLLKDLQKGNGKGGYEPIEFETEFASNYGALTELLVWSIKINFASFFEGNPVLGALVSKAKESIRGISTGESGE